MHHLPPEAGGVEDVGFVDRDDPGGALAGDGKGGAGDPLDLVGGVDHVVVGDQLAVFQPGAVLAEVRPADQLPHQHQVDPLPCDLGF